MTVSGLSRRVLVHVVIMGGIYSARGCMLCIDFISTLSHSVLITAGNGSQAVTQNPLNRTKTDPFDPLTHDPSTRACTGSHRCRSRRNSATSVVIIPSFLPGQSSSTDWRPVRVHATVGPLTSCTQRSAGHSLVIQSRSYNPVWSSPRTSCQYIVVHS